VTQQKTGPSSPNSVSAPGDRAHVPPDTPGLELRDIAKHYGAVTALRGATISVYANEVVGLIGDNGAGKSTAIKIMAGAIQPSTGEILLNGEPVVLHSPYEAIRQGIETVYQDLALAEDLTVWENIFLGREPYRKGPARWLHALARPEMVRRTESALAELKTDIPNVRVRCKDLSGGQRQAVAVSRAVVWGTRLLLLDEPTAALGTAQTERVADLVREAKSRGIAVLVISHDLPWVKANSDRLVVLYRGTVSAVVRTNSASLEDMVRYITGSARKEPQ